MTVPRVLSVNVGGVRAIEWRGGIVTTGIWKHPASGRVALRGVNFAGDDQGDRTVHGGPDKAVYAYSREDYDFWREQDRPEHDVTLRMMTQALDDPEKAVRLRRVERLPAFWRHVAAGE